ncbi:MAG: hypothetical protein IVW51_12035 [Thermaceae bacterium]|nr:hypothetical protein [Thermaceae bacterium]
MSSRTLTIPEFGVYDPDVAKLFPDSAVNEALRTLVKIATRQSKRAG